MPSWTSIYRRAPHRNVRELNPRLGAVVAIENLIWAAFVRSSDLRPALCPSRHATESTTRTAAARGEGALPDRKLESTGQCVVESRWVGRRLSFLLRRGGIDGEDRRLVKWRQCVRPTAALPGASSVCPCRAPDVFASACRYRVSGSHKQLRLPDSMIL
jgi:hypothetical protein